MAKVDFEVLAHLIKESVDCIDILVEQNSKIQQIGGDLKEYLKDSSYGNYETAFTEGNRNVKKMAESLNDLINAVSEYGKNMYEEV